MELFEAHFEKIDGNLTYDSDLETYEMFSKSAGVKKHLNYLTFKKLFKEITSGDIKCPNILESGIASAGTNSTFLFNEYVRKYGGFFWSVDTNQQLVDQHKGKMCPATQLVCSDSVAFFKDWTTTHDVANIIYLDSYDLDFYNPTPSGNHGLYEYEALIPAIKKNTLLLIDDTPKEPYWLDTRGKLYSDMCNYYHNNKRLPGKGMFVLDAVSNADMLIHNYQVLYKFYDSPVRK